MKIFVTGALGFLGTHIVNRLWADGHHAIVYDRKPQPPDYPLGRPYYQGDLLDSERLRGVLLVERPDLVVHLAALADVSRALVQWDVQLDTNLRATAVLLDAMSRSGVTRIAFTSSAVVYGDTADRPREDSPRPGASADGTGRGACVEERLPQQTSVYGAMKLASESLINAYAQGYGFVGDILRLVSVVGAGYRHGNLMDFYQRLKADPDQLTIRGNASQEKYYVHIHDVVDALLRVIARPHTGTEIWNVSHPTPNRIEDSVLTVCEQLHLHPVIERIADPWAGDLPQLVLDCSKLQSIGWSARHAILDGMRETVHDFVERGL
jgi:UDP-glucose 4-epimerase